VKSYLLPRRSEFKLRLVLITFRSQWAGFSLRVSVFPVHQFYVHECCLLSNGTVQGDCVLLGYYAAYNGNSLPKLRNNLQVESSRIKNPLMMGPMCCPETSVRNSHYTPRNVTEEGRSHILGGRSIKSRRHIMLARN